MTSQTQLLASLLALTLLSCASKGKQAAPQGAGMSTDQGVSLPAENFLKTTTPRYELGLEVYPASPMAADQPYMRIFRKSINGASSFGYAFYPSYLAYGKEGNGPAKTIAWDEVPGIDQQTYGELQTTLDAVRSILETFSEDEVRVFIAPLFDLQGVLGAPSATGPTVDKPWLESKISDFLRSIKAATNPNLNTSFYGLQQARLQAAPAESGSDHGDSPDAAGQSDGASDPWDDIFRADGFHYGKR